MSNSAPEAPAYTYRAVVRSIYDGDTIRVDLDLGFGIWLHDQALRLTEIDTPEIRGVERPDGLRAKAFVEDMIPPGTEVIVRTFKDRTGKYGRWLAEVWRGVVCVNAALMAAGLAVPYGQDWRTEK